MRVLIAILLASCGAETSLYQAEPDPQHCDPDDPADAGELPNVGSFDTSPDASEQDAGEPPAELQWRPWGWDTREILFGSCVPTAVAEIPCVIEGQQIILADGALLIGLDEPVIQGSGVSFSDGSAALTGHICRDVEARTVTAPVYECMR